MNVFSAIKGIVNGFFQPGGPASPGLNANGIVLETRNASNSLYATHRAGEPQPGGPSDLVTQNFLNVYAIPVVVWQPGGGSTSIYVRDSFAQAYAYLRPGGTLLVDFTFNRNPAIPAGTYPNLYELAAYLKSTQAIDNPYTSQVVNVTAGVTLPNLSIVSGPFNLKTLTTAAAPALVRGDQTTMIFRDGAVIEKAGTGPAIKFTPGNAGANPLGPVLIGLDSLGVGLGFENNDFEIAPLTATPNHVMFSFRNSGLNSGSVTSSGAFAANALLDLTFNDVQSASNSTPFVPGTIPAANVSTTTIGFQSWQFGAATSGTSVIALNAWIPLGNAATLQVAATPSRQNGAHPFASSVLTSFEVSFEGSGTTTGNNTTFALYRWDAPYSGPPVAVPGASFVLDITVSGENSNDVSFADWNAPDSFYFVSVGTTSNVPVAFTQITARLS
jgi:hypothetical protein